MCSSDLCWSGTLKAQNPILYQTSKACVLGLGYGASAARFCQMAPLLTGGQFNPDPEQAEDIVARYRGRNRKITNLWRRLDNGLLRVGVELPAGR